MSEDPDELAAQARRRRLRAALDDRAPDPMTMSDRAEHSDPKGRRAEAPSTEGLSEEDLKREIPPHHGS